MSCKKINKKEQITKKHRFLNQYINIEVKNLKYVE